MIDRNEIRRIVLIGFMGAGKSTVGALLANRLGWQFTDADSAIEHQQQICVAELFSLHGEEGFRKIEADVIQSLRGRDKLVLALGGGAVETAAVRELLNGLAYTCVVYLEAPLEVMIKRCEQQAGAAARPIFREREKLAARLTARLPHYRNAHLTISTAGISTETVVIRILEALEKTCIVNDSHSLNKEIPIA